MPSPAAGTTPQTRPDIAGTVWELPALMASLGFIAHLMFPMKRVRVQSNQFGVIPVEAILKNPNTLRNAKSGYKEVDWTFETNSYATVDRGLKGRVDAREELLYESFFDAEVATTEILEMQMAIDYEARVAAKCEDSGVFTQTAAAEVPWSTHATAKPIDDVLTGKIAIFNATGMWPDTLEVVQEAFEHLINCNQIVERVKYQGFVDARPGNISAQALAQALNLSRVVVAGAPKGTATEGQAAVIASIWDRTKAMLCKTADSDNLMMPCIGRTFVWDQRSGTAGHGGNLDVSTYADIDGETSWVRLRNDTDDKVIRAALGYTITTVIA